MAYNSHFYSHILKCHLKLHQSHWDLLMHLAGNAVIFCSWLSTKSHLKCCCGVQKLVRWLLFPFNTVVFKVETVWKFSSRPHPSILLRFIGKPSLLEDKNILCSCVIRPAFQKAGSQIQDIWAVSILTVMCKWLLSFPLEPSAWLHFAPTAQKAPKGRSCLHTTVRIPAKLRALQPSSYATGNYFCWTVKFRAWLSY